MQKSPVRTVHHYQSWKKNPELAGSDTFDGLHPNLQGQNKMAAQWFKAMKPFLKKQKKR
jgi:lysophospholipase L1-like esterase